MQHFGKLKLFKFTCVSQTVAIKGQFCRVTVVQTLNSPFFPSHIGTEYGRAKRESRITCMRMLTTPPFPPPKSGEKPNLEALSCGAIFWIIIFKQQFLHSDWLKTCQLIPGKSVEFHHCHAKPHSFCFCDNTRDNDNERNLHPDLLTIENTDSDLKVHALHYANEPAVRVRLSFQKLLQTRSTCRNNTKKNCLGKE